MGGLDFYHKTGWHQLRKMQLLPLLRSKHLLQIFCCHWPVNTVLVCVQGPVARCVHSLRIIPRSWQFQQTSSDPSAPTATQTPRVYHDCPLPDAHTRSAAHFADRWINHAVSDFHFIYSYPVYVVLYVTVVVFYISSFQPCVIKLPNVKLLISWLTH